MKRIGMLPCMLTLGNLLCGFGALAVIAHAPGSDWSREILIAAWLIMLAMVFDMFDGKVARATNQMSDFGGELDSLCDIVSFGAAPALIIYVLCYRIFHYPVSLGLLLSGCYVCATAVRLARFNVDNSPDQEAHQFFKGLASPAAAGAIASLVILNHHLVDLHRFMGSAKHASSIALEILPIVALASAGLMVSSVPYIHFTNLLVKRRRPPELAVLCAAFGLFLIFQTEFTIFCVFGGYMASGPMAYFHRRAFGAEELYEEEDEEEDEEAIV